MGLKAILRNQCHGCGKKCLIAREGGHVGVVKPRLELAISEDTLPAAH